MILITGSSGLLGNEIVSLCNSELGITSKDCDLTKSNHAILALKDEQVSTVIHCAARVGGVKANTDYVADFFDENIKMNINVLNACKERNFKLVSVLSTCIYPDAPYVKYPLTEEQLHVGPPHPSNFGYAYAKRMLEVQARAYRQQHGCNFISVIPNNLYGMNDNYHLESGHVIPALIRKFYEAKINDTKSVVVWGSGKPLREFNDRLRSRRTSIHLLCRPTRRYRWQTPHGRSLQRHPRTQTSPHRQPTPARQKPPRTPRPPRHRHARGIRRSRGS